MTAEANHSSRRENVIYRAVRQILQSAYSRQRLKNEIAKWSTHADDRHFDWKWTDIHYNRIAAVNLLVSKSPNCAYLEIGCASNSLFDSVPATKKIGVDPAMGGNMRMTSDEFFRQNNESFDVIFIDGLHTYEQARRDVINSIKSLNKGGWIALHDMLPRDWIEHHVPMVTAGDWTGDVWKVAFELEKTEGVDFKILKIDHGVGIFKLTSEDAILQDMTDHLREKEFAYLYDNIQNLPLIDWNDAQAWLRS